MPPELRERLAHLTALPYPNRAEAHDQVVALLNVFDQTGALQRTEAEIAVDPDLSLLPTSPERANELERRRASCAELRTLALRFALEDGCSPAAVALAAGIDPDEVLALAGHAP